MTNIFHHPATQERASLSPAVTEELRAIRDRVVHLLDLCSSPQPPCPPQEASLPEAEVEASAGQGLQPGSREFDPLGQEQQVRQGCIFYSFYIAYTAPQWYYKFCIPFIIERYH